MKSVLYRVLTFVFIAMLLVPAPAMASSAPVAATTSNWLTSGLAGDQAQTGLNSITATDWFTVTLMHTNDFHGQLEASGSNPGLAKVATKVNDIRTAVGVTNTLLLDAGDEMQGSLLSNLWKGEPVIAGFNQLGYAAATFGNHEFDWGQTVLLSRTLQADYPYVSANIVVNDTGDCATAGWSQPAFVDAPYVIKTVGAAPNTVQVGIIGVTTQEVPYITIASATAGLCFKDPTASILHYYDEMKTAGAQVMVALSHLGYADGGYGYGITVYGDQTLATNLITADKPLDLIIGGHSHTNLSSSAPTGKLITVSGHTGQTMVGQAYYNGRQVGQASVGFSPSTSGVNVAWKTNTDLTALTPDAAMAALIATYATDPGYVTLINTVIGYSKVWLTRNYNDNNMMGDFIDDALYHKLNTDADATNDVDMFLNNAGGLRADITSTLPLGTPFTLTYGSMFSILPFGNATAVGSMTGAQIIDLFNQSATLFKGTLQISGIKYKFYRYSDALPGPQPWAWGAYDIQVYDKGTSTWVPIDATKTYKVGTNEFLAPAGQDGYVPFKYMTDITYWGDMLDLVNADVTAQYGTPATAYNGPNNDGLLDDRIARNGTDIYGGTPSEIIPLTVLQHSDSHGNLMKGTYVGYTQLATLINQERAHNPTRNLLLSSGDNIQGDSMMYYYRTAPQGFASDGTTLPMTMTINPLIKAFNYVGYDAMTLGNHEYNFGSRVFTTTFTQAAFPILQANVADTGAYGLDEVPVEPYITKTVGTEGIKVAILGIGNHRIPNYELPSNIPGLSFSNPISKTQDLAPGLKASNDLVIGLTHIGFTENPTSVEIDANVDTNLAQVTTGLDLILGGHSHTNPATGFGAYKYLPAVLANADGDPVWINHPYRYNNTLDEMVVGFLPDGMGGYTKVSTAGRYISVGSSTTEDAAVKALIQPYSDLLTAYNTRPTGYTTAPIDALSAFTQETNAANLQADSAVWSLAQHGINVDFHLSGAMTNKKIANTATLASPYLVTIADQFVLMPYENSLVTMNINGPQLKAILERAYRNYYYYNYVPDYGGFSHYTTCMIDINSGGEITYRDEYPTLPTGDNVVSLEFDGAQVDFTDAATYYHVSTVNYLAAGSCNFNDGGVSLWPLSQIVNDTQYYVRDVVIDYMTAMGTVSPAIERRLLFTPYATILSGPSGYVTEISATFTFTGTDDTVDSSLLTFECQLDGGGWAACTSPVNYPALAEGVHTFQVRSIDPSGHIGLIDSRTWTVDATKPVVTIDSGPDDPSLVSDATFAFSVTDNVTLAADLVVECLLDSGNWAPCTSPVTFTGLANGYHIFMVRAIDQTGNVQWDIYSWLINTETPQLPVYLPMIVIPAVAP